MFSYSQVLMPNKRSPKNTVRYPLALKTISRLMLFVSLLASPPALANVTLKDALSAAVEIQNKNLNTIDSVNIQSHDFSAWLDGAPFVSVSVLRSQESLGTNEVELGLTLPIKSTLVKRIEAQLQQNTLVLKAHASRQQALYLSGQLRELLWNAQILKIKLSSAAHKTELLEQLSQRVDALSESRAVPAYIALLLDKESIENALVKLDYEYQLNSVMAEFRRLTGLVQLPDDIQESSPEPLSYSVLNHPDIALLDGAWARFSAMFKSSNQQAEPYQLTLSARRIEVANFDENQIGLGFEMPIAISEQYSPSQRTEYRKAKTEYEFAKQGLHNTLVAGLEQAKRDLDFYSAKQTLLDSLESPIQELEQIIPTLLNANIENKESVIRSALEVIDARADIQLNRVALQKQVSMLKQAAGIAI